MQGEPTRQQKGAEKLNGSSARVPPSMCMKTKDGNSPNPGELHFISVKIDPARRVQARPLNSKAPTT